MQNFSYSSLFLAGLEIGTVVAIVLVAAALVGVGCYILGGFLKNKSFIKKQGDIQKVTDKMLEENEFDGIIIGTRCNIHTELAVKVLKKRIPLFLEKPVAISMEQFEQLKAAYEANPTQVVVSFPLRLTNLVDEVREVVLLENDLIEKTFAWTVQGVPCRCVCGDEAFPHAG